MNAPLRRVAVACLLLFGILLVNANYVQVVQASRLRDDPRNTRVLVRAYETERGAIVAGGSAVARSVETKDRLKYLRTYPGGPAYAPVTGFYSLVYGSTGLERHEDDVLSGEDDRLVVRRISDLISGRAPRGGTVVLTLNRAAQEAAVRALGARRGAVVALDPRTGAVLAMVSSPSFDPAVLSSHSPADIRAAYKRLSEDAGAPLVNRAVARTYPPGSVFKIVTAAAALSSDRFDPDTRIPSPTSLVLPLTTRPLRNFGGGSCGDGQTTTLAEALRISCNTAFAQLGLDLGDDALRTQSEAFGIGRELDIPMPVARSAFPDDPDAPQTALSAIGQFDVRLTPLQAALVAAGVANDGRVMKPYLLAELQGPDLRRLSRTEPKVLSTAVSREVADELTSMMELVVASGSGVAAQIPGVRVAGKTGTAQHGEGTDPHAWFAGFAPADDPRVAVAVVVEDGGDAGSEATGGRVAAPIARAVMAAVLSSTPAAGQSPGPGG